MPAQKSLRLLLIISVLTACGGNNKADVAKPIDSGSEGTSTETGTMSEPECGNGIVEEGEQCDDSRRRVVGAGVEKGV